MHKKCNVSLVATAFSIVLFLFIVIFGNCLLIRSYTLYVCVCVCESVCACVCVCVCTHALSSMFMRPSHTSDFSNFGAVIVC